MKIQCTQENLQKAINIVSHTTSKFSNLPILNNILISASKDGIFLSATNLEIGVKTKIRGKIDKEGEFTVDSKIFSECISFLPSENIELFLEENNLVIKCGNYKTKLRGQSAEEFPIIPVMKKEKGVYISGEGLKRAINQTVFSASSEDIRPELNGVYFNINKNMLILAATDSYRLAEKNITGIKNESGDIQVIVPVKAVVEMERILSSENSDEVKLIFEESQIQIETNDTVLVSRVIEGKFPDYSQIIPDSFSTTAEFDKNKLINSIKIASIFSRDGTKGINLKFEGNGKLKINSLDSRVGEQESVIEGNINGDSFDLVLNFKYLLEGVQSIQGGKVGFYISSSTSPVIIKDPSDNDFLYLVMPIKH